MNLLSLQPALRTLTCDYNCLKRQVQDFPFMLDKAITEAKQEVSEHAQKIPAGSHFPSLQVPTQTWSLTVCLCVCVRSVR